MQDRNTAEDLVQNIFIGLWKNKEKSSIEDLKAYLFGAARNQIARHFRRGKFNHVQLEFLKGWEVTRNTEEYLAAKDTRESIEAVVSRLPSKCRRVFELSRFSFLSNKEIAIKMGISIFTVENHIKRALFYLRQSLHLFVLLVFTS
jgi:RNA polymerase sigma-70 factor (ECF subfamily)